tara:strand:+ start:211 stop:549 length:339 start_codon:yes stop_codon:yes gene_type:complete
MDVGDKCVSCCRDTSFGTGLFVNRIPADAEYESEYGGKIVFKEGQYRDGYLCPECLALPCDRCEDMIEADNNITPTDLYGIEDSRSEQNFSDGSFRVHLKCLNKEEKKVFYN